MYYWRKTNSISHLEFEMMKIMLSVFKVFAWLSRRNTLACTPMLGAKTGCAGGANA